MDNTIKHHKESVVKQISTLGNIEKGRKVPIGTVSRGFKKVAEGKWVPVKKDKKPKSISKKELYSAKNINRAPSTKGLKDVKSVKDIDLNKTYAITITPYERYGPGEGNEVYIGRGSDVIQHLLHNRFQGYSQDEIDDLLDEWGADSLEEVIDNWYQESNGDGDDLITISEIQ